MQQHKCLVCSTPYPSGHVYKTPWSSAVAKSKGWKITKLVPFKGRIAQGNHENFSHKEAVAHAFDVAVPTGTPIVASREGIVVDTCDIFKKGGLRSALKLRANYIVIRHPDGTYARYYHLMHKGVVVKKGQHVGTGEHIGYSGGTGYSGAPHLHIDIQDRYNKEIAEVRLVTATGNRQLEVAVSNVSARLPNRTESLELNLVRADPFLCTEDLLQRGRLAPDTALFCLRGKSTFAEKADVAAKAGARALIVINNDASLGEVLPNVGVELDFFNEKVLKRGQTFPQQLKAHEKELKKLTLDLIFLFVSASTGRALQTGASIRITTHTNCPRKDAFPYRKAISLPFMLEGVNDI